MWDKLKKMVFVQEEEQSTPSSVVKPTVSVPTPSLSYQDNTLSQPSFNPEIEKHFMDNMITGFINPKYGAIMEIIKFIK